MESSERKESTSISKAASNWNGKLSSFCCLVRFESWRESKAAELSLFVAPCYTLDGLLFLQLGQCLYLKSIGTNKLLHLLQWMDWEWEVLLIAREVWPQLEASPPLDHHHHPSSIKPFSQRRLTTEKNKVGERLSRYKTQERSEERNVGYPLRHLEGCKDEQGVSRKLRLPPDPFPPHTERE